MTRWTGGGVLMVAGFVALAACATGSRSSDLGDERRLLEMLVPTSIEIVEPFTRARSFDADPEPEGIELLLQAVNALGDTGVMIVGQLRVELYEFVPASADRKGRRMDQWDIPLTAAQDQRRFWNTVTQMYEFRLKADPRPFTNVDRYVVVVTYTSPVGRHLTDEYVLTVPRSSGPLGGAVPSTGVAGGT